MDMDTQLELERLFYKNNLMSRLREEVNIPEFVAHLESIDIPVEFGIDLVVQMNLHKRTTIETLIGILRHHFKDELNPCQACADMLERAAVHDLFDWDPLDGPTGRAIVYLEVSEDVRAEIELYQYPLPMSIPPNQVTKNSDIGFYSIQGSIILKDNFHQDDVCLDHINRMNSIPLSINETVVRLIQNSWKGLDKKKDDEEQAEFEKRQKAFAKYDTASRDVIEGLIISGEPFYLTHRYDKRGRSYAQGYHVNYQASAWNKACIELPEGELVEA